MRQPWRSSDGVLQFSVRCFYRRKSYMIKIFKIIKSWFGEMGGQESGEFSPYSTNGFLFTYTILLFLGISVSSASYCIFGYKKKYLNCEIEWNCHIIFLV